MPDFIPSGLKRFQHTPSQPTFTPYKQICTYNQTRQIAIQPDTSPPLSSQHKTKTRQIIKCLLYYIRVLDNTMLVSLKTIVQS